MDGSMTILLISVGVGVFVYAVLHFGMTIPPRYPDRSIGPFNTDGLLG